MNDGGYLKDSPQISTQIHKWINRAKDVINVEGHFGEKG